LHKTATGYREWAPHPVLAGRVVCTWLDEASTQRQPVLPDACIDLVWDGVGVHVAGPDTRAVPIESSQTFVGIRFRPGAAPGFLGRAASEIVDTRVELSQVWGPAAANALAFRLSQQPTAQEAAGVLEYALLERLGVAAPPDGLVSTLLRTLAGREAPGSLDDPGDAGAQVATMAEELAVSPRTLRRRCADALGYGPKTLERILRFRRALRLLGDQQSIANAAHLAGYADQAHLTHECRRLASSTPAALAATSPLSLSANGCN
jgi:AraC-like DNA-binding protein